MIELTHEEIDVFIRKVTGSRHLVYWMNYLTIRKMEKLLRKAKGIPWYYGFSDFDLDIDTCIFKPWPIYYKKSWWIRQRPCRDWLGKKLVSMGRKLINE